MVSISFALTGVIKEKKVNTNTKSFDSVNWIFTGTNPNDETHYEKEDPENPAPCAGTLQTICKIQAPEDASGLYPDMSAPASGSNTVADEINQALSSLLTPSPTLNSTVTGFRSN